jgi:peroxiredoxin Q/BCP
LRRFDVQYFAASTDTADVNAAFASSLAISFPILSDPTKAVARAYGVLAPTGLARRATVYIDARGRVVDIDRDVAPASHGAAIVARLKALGVPEVSSRRT